MDKFEYPQGYELIAGVDEVGRGPLVGAVVTAAVILDPNNPIEGLADSKKLSEKNVHCWRKTLSKKPWRGRSVVLNRTRSTS